MKKLITRIFLFFVVVALIDMAFGMTCNFLVSHAKGGSTRNHHYIAKECDKEILFFGSSRCMKHYVPKIVEDSLGMSCYNCGELNNGIVFLYGRLIMMTNRYTPKVVIYDVHSGTDIINSDNIQYLGWLKRYYDEPGVEEVFSMVSPTEHYKMLSQLYRNNGYFAQMSIDNIHPVSVPLENGYYPSYKVMDYDPVITESEQLATWDSTKKECMIRLVELCRSKGITLIFAYSPRYGALRPSCDELVRSFACEYHIPMLDHYADPEICMQKRYFADAIHMNDLGATVYTRKLVRELRNIIETK